MLGEQLKDFVLVHSFGDEMCTKLFLRKLVPDLPSRLPSRMDVSPASACLDSDSDLYENCTNAKT